MADIPPSSTPPPPPPGVPPPPPSSAGYGLPPNYQGPTAPDYPQPYQQQQMTGQQPWQQPPSAGVMAGAGAVGIMSQFTGRAGWSILIGLATIVAPFIVHFVFYVLALVGLLYGIQAIRRGQLIGGVVGIVLNVIGGLLTIFILTNR